ncbi:MAG TPA: tetratricopeptide repeat protein [Chitinophagaceae bacterium]
MQKHFQLLLTVLFLLPVTAVSGQTVIHATQPTDTLNQELPSVKLAKKKFGWNRKVYQNLVTRDNYYFNANLRLKEALDRVSRSHQDDYSRLLPMYPFDATGLLSIRGDLDSIIRKAGIGINIHDPRGKWMDNLYLVVGKAYFYKNDFTNALAAFQFINTSTAPAEKGSYSPVIGSRGYTGSSQISIATKEKTKSIFRHLPSRNDALLWMIRTYISSAQYDQAQALLNTLKLDPNFPERLQGSLAELQAWFFFDQELYAQSLQPLEAAVAAGPGKAKKTRWEYILGQLYQRKSDANGAIMHYQHVLRLSPDPLMAFYAYLNIARIKIENGQGNIDQNTGDLLKMAKKNKFERYRGIIFYALGQLEANAGNTAEAEDYLLSSIRNSNEDNGQKTLSYKLLADVFYNQQNYVAAKRYYDSTAAFMSGDFPDTAVVNTRKAVLGPVVERLLVISREDSLQQIAALPEAARDALLGKILAARQDSMEKQSAAIAAANSGSNLANSPFPTASGPASGSSDWYFYNATARAAGYREFHNQWGARRLADNWRGGENNSTASGSVNNGETAPQPSAADSAAAQNPSMASLLAALPLTPEKMKQSNDAIIKAYYELGSLYNYQLENIPAAIEAYESLLKRFPDNIFAPQANYILYLLYQKTGDTDKSSGYKNLVLSKYPGSRLADIIRNGITQSPDSLKKQEIIQYYDSTYIDYLSGDYAAVIGRKSFADSLYKDNPLQSKFDLLEAMAVIKTQPDSAGMQAIEKVISGHAKDEAITGQAKAILDALNHKQQLIDYLSRLQVQPGAEQPVMAANPAPVNPPPAIVKSQPAPAVNPAKPVAPAKDTTAAKPVTPPKPVTPYTVAAENAWFAVLEFERTDKRLLEDALAQFARYNAARHPKDSSKVEVSAYALTPNKVMLIFRLFGSRDAALDYFREIRQHAPTTIIPEINPSYYKLFIISKNNFILMNSTKDLEGYLQFFGENFH